MSTDNKALAAVSSAVVPPPTKLELLQAAAQAISEDNKAHNQKREGAIEASRRRFQEACRKAAGKLVKEACKKADVDHYHRVNATKWGVSVHVEPPIEGELLILKKAWDAAQAVPMRPACTKEILKTLKARAAGHTPESLRVSTILSIPALRKAAKEFGEKLLSSPTPADKANAVEVGGGK